MLILITKGEICTLNTWSLVTPIALALLGTAEGGRDYVKRRTHLCFAIITQTPVELIPRAQVNEGREELWSDIKFFFWIIFTVAVRWIADQVSEDG